MTQSSLLCMIRWVICWMRRGIKTQEMHNKSTYSARPQTVLKLLGIKSVDELKDGDKTHIGRGTAAFTAH